LRNDLSDAKKSKKLLENRLVSQDWEHGRALAARDEDSKSLLLEQEKMHSIAIELKESKMRVSKIVVQLLHVMGSSHKFFVSSSPPMISTGIDHIKRQASATVEKEVQD
jgi:hypothetical protein